MPGTQERQYVQEGALYNIILAATLNSGGLAVQSNQDGSLGIKLVEQVTPPEQNVFPCVGVQFSHYDETDAGVRMHEITAIFNLVVAIRRDYDPSVADTALAARLNLRNYVNDGNGNGLSVLLRGNPTLTYQGAATCIRSRIVHFEEVVLVSNDASAGVIASAIYQFETTDLVRF